MMPDASGSAVACAFFGAPLDRPIPPEALEGLTDLHLAAFGQEKAWSAESISSICENGTTALGLIGADCAVGFILLQVIPPETEVLTLAVSPDSRRQGLATALLSASYANLKACNISNILLEVDICNEPALNLYYSHEFEIVGRREDYYSSENRRSDALILNKQL